MRQLIIVAVFALLALCAQTEASGGIGDHVATGVLRSCDGQGLSVNAYRLYRINDKMILSTFDIPANDDSGNTFPLTINTFTLRPEDEVEIETLISRIEAHKKDELMIAAQVDKKCDALHSLVILTSGGPITIYSTHEPEPDGASGGSAMAARLYSIATRLKGELQGKLYSYTQKIDMTKAMLMELYDMNPPSDLRATLVIVLCEFGYVNEQDLHDQSAEVRSAFIGCATDHPTKDSGRWIMTGLADVEPMVVLLSALSYTILSDEVASQERDILVLEAMDKYYNYKRPGLKGDAYPFRDFGDSIRSNIALRSTMEILINNASGGK